MRSDGRCLAVWLAAVIGLTSSCGTLTRALVPAAEVITMTSKLGQPELLLLPRGKVTGLVLFMHGIDSDEDQIDTDPGLRPVRNSLLRAGFAIATSYAGGNNVGNPASVRDQVALLHDAESRLPAVKAVDILAFSMGALDAFLVASDRAIPRLRALALISPACNQLSFVQSRYSGAVSAAFGGLTGAPLIKAIDASDPIKRPASDYRGYRYHFWQSPFDTVVPASQTEEMVTYLRQGGVVAGVTELVGDHGDMSRLRPGAVVALFEGA